MSEQGVSQPNEQLIEKTPHCQHGKTHFAYCADCQVLKLESQLQQTKDNLEWAKSQTNYWINQHSYETERADKLLSITNSLRTELSAKDKVLEWYENDEQYGYIRMIPPIPDIPILYDYGKKARSILSQYKGDSTHERDK